MPQEKILIVEDEKEIADLIEIYLINGGYEVYKAYSGEEGLRVLDEQSIQLVILDIMMPGIVPAASKVNYGRGARHPVLLNRKGDQR
jgi:DNA-binding response OmpR family regulator